MVATQVEMTNQTDSNRKEDSRLKSVAFCVAIIFLLAYIVIFQVRHVFCHAKYKFINEECTESAIDKKGYVTLKGSVSKYFEEEKSAGHLSSAAVYFRDLNHGPVMGINETELFASASLLKLPIVLGVLRMAEEDPAILDINLINQGDNLSKIDQFFVPEKKIESNVSYTVREVIFYALAYSDNTAIQMLKELIEIEGGETHSLALIFKELGLIMPDELEDQDISTRAYASLFRLVFNSSYLNPEYSEMILDIMAKSDFDLGLKAGVPEGVEVAHKFGERFLGSIRQLHDCGIVYFPENPYLLCVMTMGDDYKELENVISTVSRMVYEEVNSRKLDE